MAEALQSKLPLVPGQAIFKGNSKDLCFKFSNLENVLSFISLSAARWA